MNPIFQQILIYIHKELESREDKSSRVISVHKIAKHLKISRQTTKRFLLLLRELKQIVFDESYPVSSALYQGDIRIVSVKIPKKEEECV